jgi:hypothetical protein
MTNAISTDYYLTTTTIPATTGTITWPAQNWNWNYTYWPDANATKIAALEAQVELLTKLVIALAASRAPKARRKRASK